MHPVTRLLELRFDAASRRYIGAVSVILPDGREEIMSASVLGSPGWPLERIARQLLGKARQQLAA